MKKDKEKKFRPFFVFPIRSPKIREFRKPQISRIQFQNSIHLSFVTFVPPGCADQNRKVDHISAWPDHQAPNKNSKNHKGKNFSYYKTPKKTLASTRHLDWAYQEICLSKLQGREVSRRVQGQRLNHQFRREGDVFF